MIHRMKTDFDRGSIADLQLAIANNLVIVLNRLGLLDRPSNYVKQSKGYLVRCVAHRDRTPSLSIQRRGNVVMCKCHGCEFEGDALKLIAAARGCRTFGDTVREAASLVGVWLTLDWPTVRVSDPIRGRPSPETEDVPERTWPDHVEVQRVWSESASVISSSVKSHPLTAREVLKYRGIDPAKVAELDLARQLRPSQWLPSWASFRKNDWQTAGYRIILPVYDHEGYMRSLRSWRCGAEVGPKRLPPSGHKASGLVLANAPALNLLSGYVPMNNTLIFVEGESDYLSCATVCKQDATVIGIISGSFGDNSGMGQWLANVTKDYIDTVVIRTDLDDAGKRYANQIIKHVDGRCEIRRLV